MILYTYDQWGNYTGEHVHVKYNPLPSRRTREKPPAGDYPVWRGKWELWEQPATPPPPTKEDFRTAVQAHIDATAQSRDYDSGVSLASYVGDPNETWAAEAAAFVAWRSSVWAFVFDWLAGVEAGTQAPPESVEALIDALPEMEWPE